MRNSPIKIIKSRGVLLKCKILLVIAEHDSPVFHEQSKHFYNVLKEKLGQCIVDYLVVPAVDHFDMLEKCVGRNYMLNKVYLIMLFLNFAIILFTFFGQSTF